MVHSNRAYAKLAEILSSELQLGGDGKLLAIAPLFHIGARSLSSGQHWRGGTVVLHRGFDAQEVIRTIERERITAIHLVPTMVQAILDAPNFGDHDLSSLRMLMYAAAPMPVPLLRARDRGVRPDPRQRLRPDRGEPADAAARASARARRHAASS